MIFYCKAIVLLNATHPTDILHRLASLIW